MGCAMWSWAHRGECGSGSGREREGRRFRRQAGQCLAQDVIGKAAALSATGRDRELPFQAFQGAGAAVHRLLDVTLGDVVADADVHGGPYFVTVSVTVVQTRTIRN